MTLATKPCDFPCPKCGSADIMRRFWAKGDQRPAKEYNQSMSRYTSVSCWNAYATKDHIVHHCRRCQYEWQTLTMVVVRAGKRAEVES